VDVDATPGGNRPQRCATGATERIRREAESYARRNPASRPKWKQYRTEEQERIIADAAITRRNLRSQARRLGFKSIDAMLNAWLPNALEVFNVAEDTPAMVRIATALEQIALELAARNAAPVAAPVEAMDMSWKCPVHKTARVMPAGIARGSGRAYPAFLKCPIQLPDGSWCNERPNRANGTPAAQPVALAPTEGAMEALLP
jgi:hypothetical protein